MAYLRLLPVWALSVAAAFVLTHSLSTQTQAASAKPTTSLGSPTRAQLINALNEIADFGVAVLMTPAGSGRADYDMIEGEWREYETHWHTGQLIWGLLEAGTVLNRPDLIASAQEAGEWWISTAYPKDHVLEGLVAAAHGDKLGALINWTTISDGTPGLFALTRITGDPRYGDVATNAGRWLWHNTRVAADVPGGAWLFYNIIDPITGLVYTDWDVHTQGVPRVAEIAAAKPAPIERVARPNIEGFLLQDMCRHTGDQIWCARFLEQADATLARQDPASGLWLQFEPNAADGSQIHPRFNVWNAEALLQAYALSGEKRYLDGAAKTARWAKSVMRPDGTLYYRTSLDGESNRAEVTGSAIAFNGILMLRLKHYGYTEFDQTIDRMALWLIRNRFSCSHPDPNLACAVINTRQRQRDRRLDMVNRDVGSSFGLRFLALYLRALSGEDVNRHLTQNGLE